MVKYFLVFTIWASASTTFSQNNDPWVAGTEIPAGGRSNPLGLSDDQHATNIINGKLHTQIYPIEVTGLLAPYPSVQRFFASDESNPIRIMLRRFFHFATRMKSLNDLLKWVGLHEYPKAEERGIYAVPYPNGKRPEYPMGMGIIDRGGTPGFTISCAACHSSNLFGKTVLGLTNRFPRANHFFLRAQQLAPHMDPHFFQRLNRATPGEVDMLFALKEKVRSIGVKDPLVLGLDTSLAQVALSLTKRSLDGWATKDPNLERSPRASELDSMPGDSKPAVWWNLKYKNRWLSDGSVISGNPVFTNILWNEIGRGTDLRELADWVSRNSQKIAELTSAVFSIEAPRYTDFFPVESISITRAQRGEKLFVQSCAKCHGHYDKGWSQPGSETFSDLEKIRTVQVRYKPKTKVIDVGTDPFRYLAMKSLTVLNDLEISKMNGMFIEPQKGYVPPPLVGIWSRWPYFHNNSAPNLCAVLTEGSQRPAKYYAGEALNPATDFDAECNGYPTTQRVPKNWKKPQFLYDSKRRGLSNRGHDMDIFIKDGNEIFSSADKLDLIQFLQTL